MTDRARDYRAEITQRPDTIGAVLVPLNTRLTGYEFALRTAAASDPAASDDGPTT